MPRAQLGADNPKNGATVFFDTSAIFSLAVDRGAATSGFPARPIEQTRAALLRAFVARVSVGIGFRTTVLALQEIASIAQRTFREESARVAGHRNWKTFWNQDRAAAATQHAVVGVKTRQLIQWAVEEIDALGIQIERPCVLASERTTAARRLHREHVDLLRSCPWLEPMDALHILKGIEIGATEFVTFDQGWAAVPGIVVYDN